MIAHDSETAKSPNCVGVPAKSACDPELQGTTGEAGIMLGRALTMSRVRIRPELRFARVVLQTCSRGCRRGRKDIAFDAGGVDAQISRKS